MEPANNFAEKLGKLVKIITSDPRKLYAVGLILIVLFPPINRVVSSENIRFQGWDFITSLGGRYQINITYLIIEFVLITVVYYLFKKKN